MLLALGACNNHPPFSNGIDSQAQLLAIQRSSSGHAQTMAAALFAAGIDICKQSLVPCPKKFVSAPLEKKADIILLPFANNAPDLLQFFADMLDAINIEKVIAVSAAGNNSAKASDYFPGSAPGIINVGALNEKGRRSSFSNWGPAVDILAPGENIKFNYPSLTKTAAGTSISAAFVAGGLSLMKSLNPLLTWKEALYYLTSSATQVKCEDYCLDENTDEDTIGCNDLCCGSPSCGALAFDLAEALKRAQTKENTHGLLEIDRSYIIFTRNFSKPKKLIVHNVASKQTEVETLIYDNNITVNPAYFQLSPNNSPNDHIIIDISFNKEPFKRQTSKIEFIIKEGSTIIDRSEVFIEYIPKT
ncbi:MAG: Alkaline protease precursor [bacterium ADurb.BinA186]|nr:MAG: Alkaline protease precursor [bacterium ADurb.BinA186]